MSADRPLQNEPDSYTGHQILALGGISLIVLLVSLAALGLMAHLAHWS